MKKFLAMILALTVTISFTACSDEFWEEEYDEDGNLIENYDDDYENSFEGESTGTDWAMYWYLCGSDLETYGGAATDDLFEMMDVELPEGVKIVIQTGGALEWQNNFVSSEVMQRYVYDHNGLNLIEEVDNASMGDPNTLVDFLSFAEEKYPADRTMVNFWNHGGGSVTGAAFDELFNNDSLTLEELHSAFENVYGTGSQDYPVDIVGFDTCLMATFATANTFSDFSNYLVASEELEPGNGWYYTGIMDALAENPTIHPEELGQVICDTFVYGCELAGTEDEITLSVTDLSKLAPVVEAYDNFGLQALDYAVNQDTAIFTRMANVANSVENYGGNTREQGYTNMMDMGQFVQNLEEYFPEESSAVIDALNDAVVYKVGSVYRPDGMGLASYFPYDGEFDTFMEYSMVSPSVSFNFLYHYALTGTFDDNGMNYLNTMLNYQEESIPELETLETADLGWEDIALYVDDEGLATMELGPEAYDILSSVTFELYYAPAEGDVLLSLGTDNDIIADWDNGIFKDNFRGVWGHIDDAICYMEIVYEGDDYNEYAVPVLINGAEYNLTVVYDFLREEFIILGARKALTEDGAADKNMYLLQEGDVIETIHYANDMNSDSEELIPFVADEIVYSANTTFNEGALFDGYYFMVYVMTDAQGNISTSSVATFEMYEGEIYTSVD